MRYAIVCIDTRGGLQPYLALGLGLARAGHDVVVVAPENYHGFVTARGLRFGALEGDVQGLMEGPAGAGVAEKGFVAAQRFVVRAAAERVRGWTRDCLAACAGADVILGGVGGMLVGEGVAEKVGARFVQAHVQPVTPTGDFPGPMAPGWLARLGRAGNRLSHALTRQVVWQPLRPAVDAARRHVLGLGPAPFWGRLGTARRDGEAVLYGYSRHVLPRPREWGPRVHVTGYWFLDPEPGWEPPAELAAFLAAGPPPVVVGFGSMSSRDPAGTTALVVEAVRACGRRAVLLAGWGGLRPAGLPDTVFPLDAAPHAWLFPRAALVVHHGGAGTTGAALRAGVPSVVVPFAADQPFWGRVVAARGAGPDPLPRKRLTAARLAAAIAAGLDEGVRREAAAIGERVRAEDGVAEAVRVLAAV
jgi:UDP:flavonoid glycosyltransferase YjiC (YdhE family)